MSRIPKFPAPNEARVGFHDVIVEITLPSLTQNSREADEGLIRLRILCEKSVGQLLACTCHGGRPPHLQGCTVYSLGPLPPLLDEIENSPQRDDVDNSRWRELLHLFPSVTNLYVSEKYVPHIAFAFQEIAGEIECPPY
jgi:hypothetical protein